MAPFLEVSDLTAFATIDPVKAQLMIDDATAMAVMAAPCLESSELSLNQHNAVRAILRGAVLRWNESGTGAVSQQAAGPFSATLDTRQERRGMFWPSEITQLQGVCSATSSSDAFTIDTVGSYGVFHNDTCSLNFGALYCSCGAVLTGGLPLYGA
jgi:hypothetical protein